LCRRLRENGRSRAAPRFPLRALCALAPVHPCTGFASSRSSGALGIPESSAAESLLPSPLGRGAGVRVGSCPARGLARASSTRSPTPGPHPPLPRHLLPVGEGKQTLQ